MTKVITSDIIMEFAPNAEADRESEDKDSENENSKNENSEAEKPDNNADAKMKFEMLKLNIFCQEIYRETETYFSVFVINLLNNKVKEKLKKLNKKIKKWNVKDEYSKKNLEWYLIQIPTFIEHFKLSKGYQEVLMKNPADKKACDALKKINEMLSQINMRHDYLDDWTISVSPKPDADATVSTAADLSEDAVPTDVADKSSGKGGVKIKIAITISDESDGWTLLREVVNVRKAGFGL